MQEDAQANTERIDGNQEGHIGGRGAVGPPKASVTRKSQSYSDFHDAVKATLGRGAGAGAGAGNKRHSRLDEGSEIKTELDFIDWYHNLEHDLLDASHDEYTLVTL